MTTSEGKELEELGLVSVVFVEDMAGPHMDIVIEA